MPFYEYECSKCRYYVEVLQKISDAPLKKCPSCGKSALKKLVSAPVFRLKGSGWYETDFKSDQEGRRNLAGADKDAPSAGAEPKEAAKTASAGEAKGATDGKGAGDSKGATDSKGTTESKGASAEASGDGAKKAAAEPPAASARAGGRKHSPAPPARKEKKAVKRVVTRSARGKGKRRGGR